MIYVFTSFPFTLLRTLPSPVQASSVPYLNGSVPFHDNGRGIFGGSVTGDLWEAREAKNVRTASAFWL